MNNQVASELFKHMAWANQKLLSQLCELPEEALSFFGWDPEWTVGKIANHIVLSEGRFISRLQKVAPPAEVEFALTASGMKALTEVAAKNDKLLLSLLEAPDEILTFVRFGIMVNHKSSTVLASAPYHATEHRAQIADILAMNKMDVINLDALTPYEFEKAQSLL